MPFSVSMRMSPGRRPRPRLESHGHSSPTSRRTTPMAIRMRCILDIVLHVGGNSHGSQLPPKADTRKGCAKVLNARPLKLLSGIAALRSLPTPTINHPSVAHCDYSHPGACIAAAESFLLTFFG